MIKYCDDCKNCIYENFCRFYGENNFMGANICLYYTEECSDYKESD